MSGIYYVESKVVKRNLRMVFPKLKKVPGSDEVYIQEGRLQRMMDEQGNFIHLPPVIKKWIAPK